jgi:hypothetical protein
MKMKVNCHRGGRVRNGPMIFAIGDANPRAPPIGSSIHGGTEGSNPASSSAESANCPSCQSRLAAAAPAVGLPRLGRARARGGKKSSVVTTVCNRDLTEADRLIYAIRLRENSVQQGDWAGLCRLLRQNDKDMSRARDLMNPCLTGHDHGENIGQIDASLEDIRYVLDTRCGRR